MQGGELRVDVAGRDIGGYVDEAKEKVAAAVSLPAGCSLQWSGQYENLARVRERMSLLLPLTLVLIVLLMYMNTKSWAKTGIVMLAVPFSLIGAFWYFATLTEVPITQALMRMGMDQGPALALLLAGPALSLPNMIVIGRVMGWKKTAVFCTIIVIIATFVGMGFGWLVA